MGGLITTVCSPSEIRNFHILIYKLTNINIYRRVHYFNLYAHLSVMQQTLLMDLNYSFKNEKTILTCNNNRSNRDHIWIILLTTNCTIVLQNMAHPNWISSNFGLDSIIWIRWAIGGSVLENSAPWVRFLASAPYRYPFCVRNTVCCRKMSLWCWGYGRWDGNLTRIKSTCHQTFINMKIVVSLMGVKIREGKILINM